VCDAGYGLRSIYYHAALTSVHMAEMHFTRLHHPSQHAQPFRTPDRPLRCHYRHNRTRFTCLPL